MNTFSPTAPALMSFSSCVAAFAPVLCPAFTDSRYFRQLGADAYGLVPVMLSNAEVATFHGIDERIPLDGLRKGCEVVYEITRRACTT